MLNSSKKAKIISIIVVCLAFFLTITLIFQFVSLSNLEKRNSELNETLTSLEETIAEYSKQKDYYQDRETYLDEYAHEVMNMAKDGETWYSFSRN